MAEEEEVEVPSLKGEPARNESFGLFFFFAFLSFVVISGHTEIHVPAGYSHGGSF